MEKQLKRRVLITGGASGIGLAAAILFAQQDDRVAILDIAASNVQAAAATIGPDTLGFIGDVRDRTSTRHVVTQLCQHWGGLDILICAAGVVGEGPLTYLDLRVWDDVMSTNVKGVLITCQEVLSLMQVRTNGIGHSRIVLLASNDMSDVGAGFGAYVTSRGALSQIARVLAQELGAIGIVVDAVDPCVSGAHVMRENRLRSLGDSGFSMSRLTLEPREIVQRVAQSIVLLCSE